MEANGNVIGRRIVLAGLGAGLIAVAVPAQAADRVIRVFKSPACGCCAAWVEHMQGAGFTLQTSDVDQAMLDQIKTMAGIAPQHAACHTALVDGYVVEGHVPARDVIALLDERPQALGLSVPGMPIGSPGMETGREVEPFDTLLITAVGEDRVFRSHR